MILVLNCGSQSIKYKLFRLREKQLQEIASEKIEIKKSDQYKKILHRKLKEINQKYSNIIGMGHRVVHGGNELREPVKITDNVLKQIKKFSDIAPLHNPYNVLGIETARKFFKKIPQVAVFDTGFYKTLPLVSYLYALPKNLADEFRKYGFHGISHQYLAEQAAKNLHKPSSKINLITCHLGGGSSITAVKKGKAIETSMGFTPMDGLAMMNRCGDIDPGIIIELSRKYSSDNLNYILNYQSGLKGICGYDSMLKILKEAEKGDKRAELALSIFCYRIKKYIGAYYAILQKVDAVVFSGAIGFNSKKIRNMVVKNLTILKGVKVLTIKTNEELAIARQIINPVRKEFSNRVNLDRKDRKSVV